MLALKQFEIFSKKGKIIKQLKTFASIFKFMPLCSICRSPEFGHIGKIIEDMSIYKKLDDTILGMIARSEGEELQTARDILHRIKTRDLYQCIGEILDADRKVNIVIHSHETWML